MSHNHSEEFIKGNLNRIAKAQGQLKRVVMLLENHADCSDVLIQLAAVIGALKKVEQNILEDHFELCMKDALVNGDAESVEQFKNVLKKLL